MDRNELPVKIEERELPDRNSKYDREFYDENTEGKSAGFSDILFLGAIMIVCFMWGMLAILLK